MKISDAIRENAQEIISEAKRIKHHIGYVVTINGQGRVGNMHKSHYSIDGSFAIGVPLSKKEVEAAASFAAEMERNM